MNVCCKRNFFKTNENPLNLEFNKKIAFVPRDILLIQEEISLSDCF